MEQTTTLNHDLTKESRKADHIEMAFNSQVSKSELDDRFYYEPLLSSHQSARQESIPFLGKALKAPLWVSSMTGGTEKAYLINRNLATACKEFGLGMGLGSCRSLLFDNERFEDFNLRPILGPDVPFFANLGVAQIEKLIDSQSIFKIEKLVDDLKADGLIIHVNPMQEWLQPEGDRFEKQPLEVIKQVLDFVKIPIIVKEVGQGFGYHSLKELMQLPLAAIDFAAHGGTNFSFLELLRSNEQRKAAYLPLAKIGHSAEEMVDFYNTLLDELGDKVLVKQVIISGGIKNFLDGYYLTEKINTSAIYGQASAFLKYAQGEYSELQQYLSLQLAGYQMAKSFLRLKP